MTEFDLKYPLEELLDNAEADGKQVAAVLRSDGLTHDYVATYKDLGEFEESVKRLHYRTVVAVYVLVTHGPDNSSWTKKELVAS